MDKSGEKKGFQLDRNLLKKGDSVFFTQAVSPKDSIKPSAVKGTPADMDAGPADQTGQNQI